MRPTHSGKGILDVFPIEITILVAQHMTQITKSNFSRCSVLCYQVCFPLRLKPQVALTPDSISLFGDGGICAPIRRYIRIVRCEIPRVLDKGVPKMNQTWNSPNRSFEGFITDIRNITSFLSLFPNIHELHVVYHAPIACEFNVYAAILRSICDSRYPIRDTLQLLNIQFFKDPAPNIDGPFASLIRGLITATWWLFSWRESTALPAPVSYRDLYSALSRRNKEFLGKEIDADKLREFGPKFSSLKTATVSGHQLVTALDDDHVGIFERSRIYYASLASAPKLDTFYVTNKLTREYQDRVEAFQTDQTNELFGADWGSPDCSSLVENLSIEHMRWDGPVKWIPDPRDSSYYGYIDCNTQVSSAESSELKTQPNRSDGLGDPKCEKLGRSVSPRQLKRWIDDLITREAGCIRAIELRGFRHRGSWSIVDSGNYFTHYKVERDREGGELTVKATIGEAPYESGMYTDPDYIKNPAAYICRFAIIFGLIVVASKLISIRLETYFMV